MRHLTPKQYARAWLSILKTTAEESKNKASRGLLFNLYKNGRLKLLPAILMELEELEAKENEITAVLVKSAREYDRGFIEDTVRKLLPRKKISLEQKIDENLLAGMVAETKNSRWNLSLRDKLDKLAKKLTANHAN